MMEDGMVHTVEIDRPHIWRLCDVHSATFHASSHRQAPHSSLHHHHHHHHRNRNRNSFSISASAACFPFLSGPPPFALWLMIGIPEYYYHSTYDGVGPPYAHPSAPPSASFNTRHALNHIPIHGPSGANVLPGLTRVPLLPATDQGIKGSKEEAIRVSGTFFRRRLLVLTQAMCTYLAALGLIRVMRATQALELTW
ncbi:hypothetical protein BZA05DRAFT_134762 [Tricharina praecox]|uniref:uncharacterized protein n=1 Tax=Tricharina praecox TaxID=43433 RepID=UPI00221ED5D8|nr:uncharacterized protein BZA05DRAFT_229282 [Tricharina praecox]XP_051336928.1 uncharacterized protein BZA05DRAFT_134762 [Tricharina praecox]KAI5841262.1 hypothetical protein BZA05DRAFT_229282 [Tricharina praecox]KAI5846722.1 hypothetical protein BZA05DRAFT_134762 [Tricharina praecox]